MQIDIILFEAAMVMSLLIFIAPLKLKYFAFLLPTVILMVVTSSWAVEVITMHKVKTIVLAFNGYVPAFWSTIPKFTIDQLSALFILMINVITFGSAIYAYGYLKPYHQSKSDLGMSMHFFSYFTLLISLLLLTMLRDGFMFLFAWE